MKKLLLICLFVSSIPNAFANTKWTLVDTSIDNDVIFVDMNSFQSSGDSITFWRMLNYGKRTKYGDLSSKTQTTINCRTRETINRYIMYYDDSNNYGRLTSQNEFSDTWRPIAPDTIMWSVYLMVCNK